MRHNALYNDFIENESEVDKMTNPYNSAKEPHFVRFLKFAHSKVMIAFPLAGNAFLF
jgi:hypothetical protein